MLYQNDDKLTFSTTTTFFEVIKPKRRHWKINLETTFLAFGYIVLYWRIARYGKHTGLGFQYGQGRRICYLMDMVLFLWSNELLSQSNESFKTRHILILSLYRALVTTVKFKITVVANRYFINLSFK